MLVGVALALAACSPTPPVASDVGISADAGFPTELAESLAQAADHLPESGGQIAVVYGDGSVWTYQRGTEPADYYLADIGSVEKTFKVALILSLVEEGILALDDPVSRWMDAPPGVTVRQLLNNTSGIAADDPNLPAVCEPGACQSYSGSGFEMLAEVVEAATGTNYVDSYRARVLDPLGLTQTFYPNQEDVVGLAVEPALEGQRGQTVSTAGDLARFAAGLYGGDLLATESLDDMLDFDQALDLAGGNECEPYAMATIRRHREDLGESWGHGGLTDGFRSWMEYFPDSGVALGVIVNNGENLVPLEPIYDALRSYLPTSVIPAPCDHDVAVLVGDAQEMVTIRPGYDGQPALSSDGSTLAYLSVFDDGIDIVLRDLTTGDEERLVIDGWDVTPRWSPDGRLLYSSDNDGDREIYVMDVETGETLQLTDNEVDDHIASFSPDGTRIVFVHQTDGHNQLWVMDSDGTNQHRVEGSHDDVWWPAWSPDGTQIVYQSGRSEPFIIDAAGGEPFRIPIFHIRLFTNPSWAPGEDILFSEDGDIWSVAPDGSRLRRLTATSSVEDMPVWGPDGSLIVQIWHLTD